MLSFEQALEEVLTRARACRPAAQEAIALADADGRTLAEPIRADRDQPPFDRSTRDGFAARAKDLNAHRALRVAGSLRAGEQWQGSPLIPGDALEIMTGAPVPSFADCVAMIEHVARAGNHIHPDPARTWSAGENIVRRAAEAPAGDVVVPAGRALGAAEIAAAAASGCETLHVFPKPKVALIATGDELVGLHEAPEPWQIRNSNSYALASLVRAAGGIAGRLAVARDTVDDLRERIAQAALWDLMILSGGVSMGKHDLVEPVLREYGAEFFFTGARIQPGKPVVFGRLPKRGAIVHPGLPREEQPWSGEWTYFFGLPGNPVSTEVCFHLFVAPLLRALAGRADLAPLFVEARLAQEVKGGAQVARFLPAQLTSGWDGVSVKLVPWQGSGDIAANARAGCFCVLPTEVESFHDGDTVRVLLR